MPIDHSTLKLLIPVYSSGRRPSHLCSHGLVIHSRASFDQNAGVVGETESLDQSANKSVDSLTHCQGSETNKLCLPLDHSKSKLPIPVYSNGRRPSHLCSHGLVLHSRASLDQNAANLPWHAWHTIHACIHAYMACMACHACHNKHLRIVLKQQQNEESTLFVE